MSAILVPGRLRQYIFKASLGFTLRPCLNNQNLNHDNVSGNNKSQVNINRSSEITLMFSPGRTHTQVSAYSGLLTDGAEHRLLP